MRYLVKNTVTGEETICEKVVVEGFYYYVSSDKISVNEYYIYCNQIGRRIRQNPRAEYPYPEYRKVIATTNKSLDLPMVIDEVEDLAEIYSRKENGIGYDDEHPNWSNSLGECTIDDYKAGYNKAKETYSFTKNDMVEFVEYLNIQYRDLEHTKALKEIGSVSESIDLWQEQRIKTILVK